MTLLQKDSLVKIKQRKQPLEKDSTTPYAEKMGNGIKN